VSPHHRSFFAEDKLCAHMGAAAIIYAQLIGLPPKT
jgi:hypothetical protein